MIKIKSIFAKAHKDDGQRILVDLFWPQEMKTLEAHVDQWIQDIGPTYDLQRFHFDKSNWETYKKKFIDELLSEDKKKNKLIELAKNSKKNTVTLLYGNRDPQYNHAIILKELIESRFVE